MIDDEKLVQDENYKLARMKGLEKAHEHGYVAELAEMYADSFALEFLKHHDEYVEIGRAIGRADSCHEIAKKMKLDNMDPAYISKLTGLSVEEIEKL